MSIDNIRFYKQCMDKVRKQEKQAIIAKKWTELAKLRVKRADFEAKIKEIELTNSKIITKDKHNM